MLKRMTLYFHMLSMVFDEILTNLYVKKLKKKKVTNKAQARNIALRKLWNMRTSKQEKRLVKNYFVFVIALKKNSINNNNDYRYKYVQFVVLCDTSISTYINSQWKNCSVFCFIVVVRLLSKNIKLALSQAV